MDCSARVKKTIYYSVLPEPAFLPEDLEDLGGADVMLHLYPDGRDLSVICLLFIGKDATLRLFKRHDGVVAGSVSDISGILIHRPLLRKAVLHVGDPLVMGVSRYGRADKKNTSRDGGDDRVLDGMPLLLAAVLILLLFTVHRTRNLPLRAVMKPVGRLAVGLHALKHALESLVGGSGHMSRFLQCLDKYAVETVEPLVALRLGHAEHLRDQFLDGVLLEDDQYEEQPFGDTRKRAVTLYGVWSDARAFPSVYGMPTEIFVMGVREIRKERVEYLDSHSCKGSEPRRVCSCCNVTHDNITDKSSFALTCVI